MNAQLFRVLEERARSLQQAAEAAQASERRKAELIASLQNELVKPLAEVTQTIDQMVVGETMRLNAAQKSVLTFGSDKATEDFKPGNSTQQIGFGVSDL